MKEHFKSGKPLPTDLSWQEENPSSYLFDPEVLKELEEAIAEAKGEIERSGSKEDQAGCDSDKDG